MTDYDEPEVEAQWLAERRDEVADYLNLEGIVHGTIGEKPAWHIAPYVSIWAIESLKTPNSVGWWAIRPTKRLHLSKQCQKPKRSDACHCFTMERSSPIRGAWGKASKFCHWEW
ncbi:DUF4826 family protein [Deefgea piscis]|uniref:DUF4826 family protein n=1 Tax=Deefgea piscis TaxID=2739061 RepID=A0A6M8SPU5_9NEIS|nr:DUF4826 family protein [Deefgea piscis]QKJ67283.1 DUF4826 family protein [Deefgea piscis]